MRLSRTFAEMVEEALQALGGRALQKDIANWVEARYPEIREKPTWRNSVSGTLSTNRQFVPQPVNAIIISTHTPT